MTAATTTITSRKVDGFEANHKNEWCAIERDEKGMVVWVCCRIGKGAAEKAVKAHAPTHTKNGR